MKAIVIGCPGSGKTTFAQKLREKTGTPLFHLDAIWHKPDRTHISREEFDARLAGLLGLEEWIIDGNYNRTVEVRLRACDTVFLFDLPTQVCIQGAMARVGKARSDMPWVETELDPDFKQWIEAFRDKNLPTLYALLERYGGDKQIHIFKTRDQADNYLNQRDGNGQGPV